MTERMEMFKRYIEKILNEKFGIYYRKAPVRVRVKDRQAR